MWLKCVEMTKNMRYVIPHMFGEDNHYTNKLDSLDLKNNDLV